jgi:xylulokinase
MIEGISMAAVDQTTYILAHDLGTTGNKSTLCSTDGRIAASCFCAYETDYLRPNWAEQNPVDWVQAVCCATQDLLAKTSIQPGDIAVISLSGHMQGATLVDREGTPLRPSILWADQRARAQAEAIASAVGKDETYRLTGSRVSPAYTAAKLMWVRDHQPEVYARLHKVLQCKDYVAFFLTGVFATDYSDASLTQLLDLEKRDWAWEMISDLGLSASLLPDLYPSAAVIGQVTAAAAAATGLKQGTPVVIGGGDGSCATVGACSIHTGDIYNYIGSSSWMALTTEQPVLDAQQRTFNMMHLDPSLYVAVGSMQAAGGAYTWLEDLLRAPGQAEPDYAGLDQAAAGCPPGGNGVLFLPYLLGERSPYWNPAARGAFIGLTMPDRRAEMARAVLEGVGLNLRIILEILQSQGVQAEEMRLIGGGSKSAVWRQILANIYELPVTVLDLPYAATALGAAIAGGVGVGIYPDYSVAQELAQATESTRPQPETYPLYRELYALFQNSYFALEGIFNRLGALPPAA